jgi:hypothetical protein
LHLGFFLNHAFYSSFETWNFHLVFLRTSRWTTTIETCLAELWSRGAYFLTRLQIQVSRRLRCKKTVRTVRYTAPASELSGIHRPACSKVSDVYALGIVIYEAFYSIRTTSDIDYTMSDRWITRTIPFTKPPWSWTILYHPHSSQAIIHRLTMLFENRWEMLVPDSVWKTCHSRSIGIVE